MDWNSYTTSEFSYQVVGMCEDATAAQEKIQEDYSHRIYLDKGSVKDLRIGSPELELEAHYSPNYLHWTPKEFLSFYNCFIAGPNALFAYPDKLLWIDGGSLVRNNLTGDPLIDQKLIDEEKIREADINVIKEYFKSQVSASTPVGATANWKTYRDEKYGFSFQYPPGYSVTDGKPNSNTVGSWFAWVLNSNQKTVVGINIFESNLTLDAFASNEKNQMIAGGFSVDKDRQQITIDGIPGLIYSYASKSRNSEVNSEISDIFYIKKGGLIYRIQLNWGSGDSDVQNIFNSFSVGH